MVHDTPVFSVPAATSACQGGHFHSPPAFTMSCRVVLARLPAPRMAESAGRRACSVAFCASASLRALAASVTKPFWKMYCFRMDGSTICAARSSGRGTLRLL